MQKSVIHFAFLALLLVMPVAVSSQVPVATPDGVSRPVSRPAQYRLLFRSGRVVVGEIVLRNEDVVIVKDDYGTRFQYPMTDITEITEIVEQQSEDTGQQSDGKKSRSLTNAKRTSLGIRAAGGVMSLDGTTGGAIAADVRMGANNVGGRRIFLGGQVGYRAMMAEQKVLSVIPIAAVLELPLTDTDHAPMIGANIGYGIGIGGIRGGVNAGLTLAYRYHFTRTGSLHIGLGAEVQQLAKAAHTVTVDSDQTFLWEGGRTAVMGLISLGVLF